MQLLHIAAFWFGLAVNILFDLCLYVHRLGIQKLINNFPLFFDNLGLNSIYKSRIGDGYGSRVSAEITEPLGFYCFETFASRKSLIIGTIVVMRFISVTCVVSGKIANLDAGRGCMSPWISPPPFSRNISAM